MEKQGYTTYPNQLCQSHKSYNLSAILPDWCFAKVGNLFFKIQK